MSSRWRETLAAHQETLASMVDLGVVLDAIADEIIICLRMGRRVLTLGNGGSAADAQHIAAELVGRFKRNRPALAALALTTDTSILTAVGNDLGFEQVFSRQVEGLARPGDVVWILSTSGNSPNVLSAAEAARRCGARVIGFSGRSGGKLGSLCDRLFCVPHESSDRIQEGHLLAYHYICERVEEASDR